MVSFDIAERNGFCVFDFRLQVFFGCRRRLPKCRRLFDFYRDLKKTLKRVCQTPELTGDQLFFKNQIYPSVNEGLNAFNKKLCHYLIFGPIRNKINEFYFNKTLKNAKQRNFYPIGMLEFRSEFHNSDRNCGFPIGNPLFRSTIFFNI